MPPAHAPVSDVAMLAQDGIGYSIPEAEHQVHQDQPEAVNRVILDFLQQKVCHAEGSTADKRKQQ